ncbi:MAG: hypothetical protein M1827_001037 [Pycnora praestabilis]|nr:MAG: hypothetical protein M1827_001037 [Pycnora praestabilis]
MDYNSLLAAKGPEDVLSSVEDVIYMDAAIHPNTKHRMRVVVEPLVGRFERFSSAIDMLAQSSPQAMGVSVVGLIWGSLKFIIMIAKDIIDTFDAVLDALESITKALPRFGIYIDLFGSSDIQLLRAPLTDIYSDLIRFGIQAIKLFDRSMLRNFGRSAWYSLQKDFKLLITNISKHREEVDIAAETEHMNQSSRSIQAQEIENSKADAFRQQTRLLYAQASSSPGVVQHQSFPSPVIDGAIDLLSPHFAGRESELEDLRLGLMTDRGDVPARCAVYGLPGIGKTQLALKYAKTSIDVQRYSHVFWISAASSEKLYQGSARVLEQLNLPDRFISDQTAKLIAAKRWLENSVTTSSIKWLLVLDNANVDTVTVVRDLLPQTNASGHVLFTTRTPEVARTLARVGGIEHVCIEMRPPPVHDAVEMLLRRAQITLKVPEAMDRDRAEKIVASVGRLPLAIDQAASFMRTGHKNLTQTLGIYSSNEKSEALEWKKGVPDGDQDSVAATFMNTFRKLDEEFPSAGHFLRILSFYDPESISVDMFAGEGIPMTRPLASPPSSTRSIPEPVSRRSRVKLRLDSVFRSHRCRSRPVHVEEAGDISTEAAHFTILEQLVASIRSSVKFQRIIEILESSSLVSRIGDGNSSSLRIHDLVQELVRTHLIPASERTQWVQQAVKLFCSTCWQVRNYSSPETWSSYETMVPHVQLLATYTHDGGIYDQTFVTVLEDCSSYFHMRGRYGDAEILLLQALKGCRVMQLGGQRRWVMLSKLAHCYFDDSRYAEAEKLQERILESCKKLYGIDDWFTLQSMATLAGILIGQGHYVHAELLLRRALTGFVRHFGEGDLRTLNVVEECADLYVCISRLEKAEQLYLQVLEGKKKRLGPRAVGVINTMVKLAAVYTKQNGLDKAEVHFKEALSVYESRPGWTDETMLSAASGLAFVHCLQHRYEEAQCLCERAVRQWQNLLGLEHAKTLEAMEHLAIIFLYQERYEDAERLFKQVLERREKAYGQDSTKTLDSLVNLGICYSRQKRYDKAEELYKQALEGYKDNQPADLRENIPVVRYLMYVFKNLGREHEAEAMRAQIKAAEDWSAIEASRVNAPYSRYLEEFDQVSEITPA